eukprot:g61159.t1
MVARCGGTVQGLIDVRLEHPAYVLYNPHSVFYALGTNIYTVQGLSRCVMAKYEYYPPVPGQQSFRHEHARQLGTFTSTWVISCMFMCLSRLSTKGFVDADSVEVHQLQRPLPGARQRCWRAATSSSIGWYIPLAASSPVPPSPTLVHAYFMRASCALLAGFCTELFLNPRNCHNIDSVERYDASRDCWERVADSIAARVYATAAVAL